MKKYLYACIFALGLSPHALAGEIEKRSKDSRIVVGDFMVLLKKELKDAMKEGGPTLSLIHISEPTRLRRKSRMPSSA